MTRSRTVYARPLVLFAFLFGGWIVAATEIQATESYWATTGGEFFDPANWSGPVPDETITAVFDLDPGPWVTFSTDALSDRIVVRAGMLDLYLWDIYPKDPLPRYYDAVNPNLATPSIVVGENPGDAASLMIRSGSMSATNVSLGLAPGSAGTVLFDQVLGLAPGLSCTLALHVGSEGQGQIIIDNEAEVSCALAVLGAAEGSSGQVSVTVPGSRLNVADTLTVGKGGFGLLSIGDHADAASGNAVIGQQLTATGEVSVTGTGATWIVDGSLDVGYQGHGILNITDGLVVTQGFATIGTLPESVQDHDPQDGGTGEVTVSGFSGHWAVGGTLYVGTIWSGTLNVLDGGTVTSEHGFVRFSDRFYDNAVGQATLQGPGSVWSNTGHLTVDGTLQVSDGAIVIADTIELLNEGVVEGDGSIVAAVSGEGTLRPGHPYGALTIDGSLSLSLDPLSRLELELAGADPGMFDAVEVTGSASVFGEVIVTLADGFVPQLGDRFVVLTAGSLGGGLGLLALPDLDPALKWIVGQDGTSLELLVSSFADLDGDGVVGVTDFLAMLAAWGPCPAPPDPCPADLDGDGVVGVEDFLILLANWT